MFSEGNYVRSFERKKNAISGFFGRTGGSKFCATGPFGPINRSRDRLGQAHTQVRHTITPSADSSIDIFGWAGPLGTLRCGALEAIAPYALADSALHTSTLHT